MLSKSTDLKKKIKKNHYEKWSLSKPTPNCVGGLRREAYVEFNFYLF